MLRHILSANRLRVSFSIVVSCSTAWLGLAGLAGAQSTTRSKPNSGSSTNSKPKYSRVQANSDGESEVRAAYLRTLADKRVKFDDFKTVFNWLTETSGKEKWRDIRWRHDLWDARIESAKTGKPIFIWAMNGDPLGCV